MPASDTYPQDYVDTCRARVESQVALFRELASAARHGESDYGLESVVRSLEPVYYNNMLLVLESYFAHRDRALEGEDGNALTEVRLLCTSMLENDDELLPDPQVTLDPGRSVLGLKVGDPIALTEDDFVRVSDAFFNEIQRRYTER
jgi:hypothetical protein